MIEKTMFGETEVHLKWINAEEVYKMQPENVTSCFVVPVFCDGKVLLTRNTRGVDIIGGHTEDGELKYDTMVREAAEEACIDIISATFIGAIKVHNPNWTEADEYPETAYQLFYVSKDFTMNEFVQSHECLERVELEVNAIESAHHNLLDVHKKMLELI